MANSILKLSVEDKEYNSKLKSAAEGIQHLAKRAHDLQGDFAYLDKAELDFIKDLGYMNTSARTASGNVRELETAYRGLATTYNQLSDFEKNDEGGKALAASLEILKQRAQDARAAMNEATKSLNDNGQQGQASASILDQLASKFTINIDAVKLFNMGLQAASAALGVAKDAFFASEANVDEWGRVVDSSRSLYEGFLTSLNTGDISGYLSNIDSIVSAARRAYDELDRLGTMKTIQAPQMSAQRTENERMRMMIQTGRYIAPIDGRSPSMKAGQLLTPEQIRSLEKKLENGMKTVVSLVGNEVKQTGKAIDAVYQRQAKELGMSLSEFRKGTSSMAEFDKRMEGYAKYQQWEAAHTSQVIDTQTGGTNTIRTGGTNPFEEFSKWGTFRVDGDRYNQLVQLITQRDQQSGQVYGMQSQAYRTMNRAEGITVRQIMNGGTSSGGTGGGTANKEVVSQMKLPELGTVTLSTTESMKELQAQLAAYKQQLAAATNVFDYGEAQQGIEQTQKRIEAQPLALSVGLDTDSVVEMQENLNATIEEMRANIKPLEVDVETGNGKEAVKTANDTNKAWQAAASAISSAGSAMQNIEDPAAKVAGIVMQAIASVALGFAQASAEDGKLGVFGWIAAVAAGLATMTATIASIKSATKGGFAEGGIVPGNSWSGDNLRTSDYGINSGELILNKAQQHSIAQQLEDGGNRGGTGMVSAIVSAEQLRLVLRNGASRRGRVVSEWLNG